MCYVQPCNTYCATERPLYWYYSVITLACYQCSHCVGVYYYILKLQTIRTSQTFVLLPRYLRKQIKFIKQISPNLGEYFPFINIK